MNIFKLFITAVYPNKCIGCGEIIDENRSLCDFCEQGIERIPLDKLCDKCGFEQKYCCCEHNIYRFCGIVSVFENTGIAKQAYYAYKFSKKQHYSNFFAQEMSNAVEKIFSNINFDFVCSVPSSKKLFAISKYKHSAYLAKNIAKSLSLKYEKNILKTVKRKKPQHKSTLKERLNNVNGVYAASFNLDNSVVLLVDDIRTTCATLDECAKVLLFAGAKAVYCVTALTKQKQTS